MVPPRPCCLCGTIPGHFGFGPPLTPCPDVRWTCRGCRGELEQVIAQARQAAHEAAVARGKAAVVKVRRKAETPPARP